MEKNLHQDQINQLKFQIIRLSRQFDTEFTGTINPELFFLILQNLLQIHLKKSLQDKISSLYSDSAGIRYVSVASTLAQEFFQLQKTDQQLKKSKNQYFQMTSLEAYNNGVGNLHKKNIFKNKRPTEPILSTISTEKFFKRTPPHNYTHSQLLEKFREKIFNKNYTNSQSPLREQSFDKNNSNQDSLDYTGLLKRIFRERDYLKKMKKQQKENQEKIQEKNSVKAMVKSSTMANLCKKVTRKSIGSFDSGGALPPHKNILVKSKQIGLQKRKEPTPPSEQTLSFILKKDKGFDSDKKTLTINLPNVGTLGCESSKPFMKEFNRSSKHEENSEHMFQSSPAFKSCNSPIEETENNKNSKMKRINQNEKFPLKKFEFIQPKKQEKKNQFSQARIQTAVKQRPAIVIRPTSSYKHLHLRRETNINSSNAFSKSNFMENHQNKSFIQTFIQLLKIQNEQISSKNSKKYRHCNLPATPTFQPLLSPALQKSPKFSYGSPQLWNKFEKVNFLGIRHSKSKLFEANREKKLTFNSQLRRNIQKEKNKTILLPPRCEK